MAEVGRIALAALVLAGCMRPVEQARTTRIEPPAPAEEEAAVRVGTARCSVAWGFLFPGLSQLCLKEDGKAAVLGGLGAAELSTSIAVATQNRTPEGEADFEHPGSSIPLIALQDLYVYGLADGYITRALANRELYTPRDSLTDLVAAPFNGEVMKRPEVWAGILGSLAVGITASLAISGGVNEDRIGEDPVLFEREFEPAVGYSIGAGAGAALFTHVAIAEEALFRGVLQSSIARAHGETEGWIYGSLIFGAVHAPNALALEPSERKDYLLVGLPVITALGAYMGWVYRDEGYALGPPTAIHFWYDFLLSATFFALEPQESPLSMRLSIPF